jgi:hypothetical protein
MNNKKARHLTQIITIPNPTTGGTMVEQSVNLDANYKKCTGFSVAVITSTPGDFELGLRNDEDQLQDMVYYKHLTVNESVPTDKRFHPLNIAAMGRKITIQARPFSTLETGAQIQFVFALENE